MVTTGGEAKVTGEPTARQRDTAEPLWGVTDAATWLGVPVATLYKWRHLGKGPRAYRLGRHLKYVPDEVRTWVATGADEPPTRLPRHSTA